MVLPYIKMNPSQVYTCSLSWTLLPPHTIPLGRPSAPAPSIQYRASNLDWLLASSFRMRNSSTGTPSPPLALFILMLLKPHLTSHTRMSGSRWVITPSWLSGTWRSSLYSYSVYSCHLFLISSTSVRSIPFLSFIVTILAWNVPLVCLIFLKRSLLSHSIVFLYFFALITEEGFRIPLFFGTLYSNECIFPFLLCLLYLFFF